MRTTTHIIIHCSATRERQNITAKTIDEWHRKRGYNCIGYQTSSGYGIVDNLTLGYNGNQLSYVTDAAVKTPDVTAGLNDFKDASSATSGEYAYNRNGAMSKDLNKGISNIAYNSLNLPTQLTINGITNNYKYAANGAKLKVTRGTDVVDYVGNKVYEKGSLKRILVDGGYIENGVYHFYIQDHQGNNRVVATGTGTVVQRNHYYPFGMTFGEIATTEQDKQAYKYNGKELDRKNGLNLYDYSARYMEPALGRFTTIDPLAEKYYSISPYAYCANNPMRFVDPDGRDFVIWYNDNRGKQRAFIFNGTNTYDVPNNSFVRSVVKAYNYNTSNGGGRNVKAIATNSNMKIGIIETNKGNKYGSNGGFIRFNPNAGLELEDGSILSPATGLEHEAAHAVNDKTVGIDDRSDAEYDTMEERKVIKGAELETAKANGELPKTHQGRKKHREGKWIVTKSVTSNKEADAQQSIDLRERINNFNTNWTSE